MPNGQERMLAFIEQITDPLDSAISKYVEKGNSDNNDKNVLLSGKKFR